MEDDDGAGDVIHRPARDGFLRERGRRGLQVVPVAQPASHKVGGLLLRQDVKEPACCSLSWRRSAGCALRLVREPVHAQHASSHAVGAAEHARRVAHIRHRQDMLPLYSDEAFGPAVGQCNA